jgi:hypothetical protein
MERRRRRREVIVMVGAIVSNKMVMLTGLQDQIPIFHQPVHRQCYLWYMYHVIGGPDAQRLFSAVKISDLAVAWGFPGICMEAVWLLTRPPRWEKRAGKRRDLVEQDLSVAQRTSLTGRRRRAAGGLFIHTYLVAAIPTEANHGAEGDTADDDADYERALFNVE